MEVHQWFNHSALWKSHGDHMTEDAEVTHANHAHQVSELSNQFCVVVVSFDDLGIATCQTGGTLYQVRTQGTYRTGQTS